MLAESIDEFHSSEDDVDFDDSVNQTDQDNSHQDFDHCHDADDHDPQNHLDDLDISIDKDVNKGNDFKDLSQERDEDSQSINSVAR